MIEVRFPGRGGQGAKIASRILGRSGFLAGLHAQDFALFGAERRGAPVVACTRISEEPIDRRGYVEEPDVVVVMDDSLLKEVRAQILNGVGAGTPMIINTAGPGPELGGDDLPAARFIAIDLAAIARRILGGNIFLSAVAAGATAKCILAITAAVLADAVRLELREFGLSTELGEKNVLAAAEAYASTPPLVLGRRSDTSSEVIMPGDPLPYLFSAKYAAPTIQHRANAALRDTGSWRMERPEIALGKCKRCFLCYLYCPDTAISLDAENFPHVDYDHCKGCMICYEECPTDAISRSLEA